MTIEYISGYFDGEGCVGMRISKRKRKATTSFPWAIQPSITIGSYDYSIQDEIQKFLENYMTIGISWNSYKPRNSQTQIERRLTVSGWESAEKFVRMLLPYSIGKKPQLEIFLKIIELRAKWQLEAPKHKNNLPLMTKEWFLKFIQLIDEMNSYKHGKRGKFNLDFFR